jgi:putative DNA primase/helicase
MIATIEANFPAELRELDQWVGYRIVLKEGAEKPTKVPYSPYTETEASTTKPTTWGPYTAACASLKRFRYDGKGFVFTKHDPYAGIDFDNCVANGRINPEVWAWVQRLDSYAEYSPSGTGIHFVIRGIMPGGRGRKNSERGVEVYDRGRYFTVTDQHVEGTPTTVNERQPELEAVLAEFFPAKKSSAATQQPAGDIPADDKELLGRMLASRNGDKIQRLLDGNCSDYRGKDGKPDHSGADQALCNYLAFFTGNDRARMDRLFRQSRLYREKWERQDYRNGTIDKAVADTTEVYRGKRRMATAQTNGHSSNSAQAPSYPNDLPDKPSTTYTNGNGNHSKDARVHLDNADALLLSAERNDTGNAIVGKVLHGDRIVYTSEMGWLYKENNHWERDEAEAQPRLAAIDTLQKRSSAVLKAMAGQDGISQALQAVTPSAKHVRDMLYLLKPMVTVSKGEFDNAPHLVNTLSGVVDLRNGDVVANETSMFTYVINAEYVPGAWLDGLYPLLMSQWFNGDQERIEYMQRALGYTLTGETREECLFWLNGERGRNGKGTMVNSVASLLGSPLAHTVAMKAFTARTTDPQGFLLAPLHNARMAIASENSKNTTLDGELIKTVTGRDSIQVAFKGRTPFNFTPKFKLWMMANNPPKGDTTDDAFWSRVRVVTMPNSYLGREDNTIKDRLQTAVERTATLSWLVMGAIQWYRCGLGTPLWVQQETQRVRAEQDTVLQFADACLEAEAGTNTPFAEVYRAYEDWCTAEGQEPKASNNLSKELRLRGYATDKKSVRVQGNVNPKQVTYLVNTRVVT